MSKVYLIITTCIKNNVGITWSDKRKQEYYLAIANALNLCPPEITPIIVENSSENNKSYLDVFKCDILYTNDNSRLIKGDKLYHKGHRELIDINKVIDKYDIQPNDLIIKLTGRYLLFQNDFFTTVLANPDKDCFFRQYNVCTYEKDDISIVLGLFALRCKYFKVFEYKNHDVGAEEDFRTMINNYVDPNKIVKVEKLWLRVFLGETGKMLDV